MTDSPEVKDRSLWERALTPAGIPFLRLLLVTLAAFFIGFAVQRVILGNYALSIGPVTLPSQPGTIEQSAVVIALSTADQGLTLQRKTVGDEALVDVRRTTTMTGPTQGVDADATDQTEGS
jgi:hypothetical protein